MERREFIQISTGLMALTVLESFKEQESEMPVLFIGHGSPMNALEDNEFSRGWRTMATDIPVPTAILCISAHWETKGTFVTAMENPKTIHDFGGFPAELFAAQYPAPGSIWLAEQTQTECTKTTVQLDNNWGLDHGCWSVLKQMYPDANIPVVQLSLDYTKDAQYQYNLAQELTKLRKKGVLIIGSGNMVHSFKYAVFSGNFNQHFGHDWALEANETFKKLILNRDIKSLADYKNYSKATNLSAPTPEHYLPLMYTLGAMQNNDAIHFFNDAVVAGSFSMTCVKIDKK